MKTTVKLGDVVKKVEENEFEPLKAGYERFVKVEHMDADNLRIHRWGSIKDDLFPPTFHKVFRKGQILFPTRNPHLRRVVVADFDGICGEKTLTLSPIENKIEPSLVAFIFQSDNFVQHCINSIIGSTNPHVRWRDIAEYKIDLPERAVQKKISELLLPIAEHEYKLEILLDVTKKLKKEYIEKEIGNNSLGDIKRLGDYISILKGTSYASEDYCEKESGNIFINLACIKKGGGFNEAGIKYYEGFYKPTQTLVEGDILVPNVDITRNGDVLGYPIFIPKIDNKRDIVFSMDLTKIEIKNESLDRKYLYYLLHSDYAHNFLKSHAGGSTVLHLKTESLKDLEIRIPDLASQKRISDLLSAIDDYLISQQIAYEAISTLKKKLTNYLLSGEPPIAQEVKNVIH